uniref:Uncharacterized protein n=1 Tax=Vitrella brassicaformis TaxID=1169539 RepID=A0A7S1JJA9_9ALVE|mmetsp:Transcript_10092/g.24475  ORF Transcript_10092/g.24475 Transcript_10092/m.24475 type:complete len:106 (+) Transcript_10092:152-469(+)
MHTEAQKERKTYTHGQDTGRGKIDTHVATGRQAGRLATCLSAQLEGRVPGDGWVRGCFFYICVSHYGCWVPPILSPHLSLSLSLFPLPPSISLPTLCCMFSSSVH